jgi:hypothetical protein
VTAKNEKTQGFEEAEQALLLPPLDLKVSPKTLAEIRQLYHEAFRLYGSVALWSSREHDEPSADQALVITMALRIHGGMDGRRLAERIERLCHAAD